MQRTMPGTRWRRRPRTAWVDTINTRTRLLEEESIRMTEYRDKWKKVRPTLGSRAAKEQNRTFSVSVNEVNVNVNVSVEFKVTLHEQVRYRGTLQY